jgi:hypothetical protein
VGDSRESASRDLRERTLRWHTDEAAWPEGRDLAKFKAWFVIELHSVVEDLCDYEIVDEDDEA